MKYMIILSTLVSCSSIKGPVYQGSSHNDQLRRNKSVVLKEDRRMKKAMSKERHRSSTRKMKHSKHKRNKKYI